jgi:hypothetical protein
MFPAGLKLELAVFLVSSLFAETLKGAETVRLQAHAVLKPQLAVFLLSPLPAEAYS